MTIRQIEYVLAIARHKGLRRAAVHLGKTEATVSEQIRKLEKELGITLFYRSRSTFEPLVPSDECKQILPSLQRFLETYTYVRMSTSTLREQRARQEANA